ncbi:DNA modification methylase [Flavobacterium sp.]|uniref:DNA modification methylase n=1 Tax=Flavobacterium sp. TaxID=239 RepID=UPI002614F428|nr:DNA modification methylase [Flavobacterium sp.]
MRLEIKQISEVRPNPFIEEFYGKFSLQKFEDIQLYKNIEERGIDQPIKITKSGLIISGNRRYYCAKFSTRFDTIPVLIEDIEDYEVTEYMIVSLQLQRTKTEIQVAKEYMIIGEYYNISRGKGDKEGKQKRDELLANTNCKGSTIKRVLTSFKLVKELDNKIDDDSAWEKLEELNKSKSISAIETYLKNIVGEKKNEKKVKKLKLNNHDSFKIYTRSCEDLSDIVEDQTIDCVCSSPPYPNSIRTYSEDGKSVKKGVKKSNLKQLGQEDTIKEYIDKMVVYVRECIRTLKPTGSIWINIMDVRKNGNYLNVPEKLLLALEKEHLITAQKVIWFKNNPPYDNNNLFQPSMEHIFHFVLDAKKYKWRDNWFNEADEFLGRITYGNKDKKRKFRNVFFYETNKDERNENDGAGMVNSLIETNVINNSYLKKLLSSKGLTLLHNALFDFEIPMICILSTTDKGDSVMDIFSGLGTSGLIAYCAQCKYFGIEQSGVYSAQSYIRFEDFLEKNPKIQRIENIE